MTRCVTISTTVTVFELGFATNRYEGFFEAAIALGAGGDLPHPIGRLDTEGADLLGVKGITLLAVRPDGYVGMRCDRDHLGALERYRSLFRR